MRFSPVRYYDFKCAAAIFVDDNGHTEGCGWKIRRNHRLRGTAKVTLKQIILARTKLKAWVRGRLNKFGCRK